MQRSPNFRFLNGWLSLLLCSGAPTAAQVIQVADTNTGPGPVASSSPRNFLEIDALCFFTAEDRHGRELWVTDGTNGGTRLVKDVSPHGSGVFDMAAFEGLLYFAGNDGSHGSELWRSDGTPEGTVLVQDLQPGPTGSGPDHFAVVGSRLYFSATTEGAGRELWYVEGGQPVFLGDVRTGEDSLSPDKISPWGDGGHFVFEGTSDAAGRELWSSDGTLAGTQLVADVVPGPESSRPTPLFDLHPWLFFSAQDPAHGRELWLLLPATTHPGYDLVFLGDLRLGTLSSNPSSMTLLGSTLVFEAHGSSGREIWTTDGTPGGTQVLVEVYGGSGSGVRSKLTLWQDRLFFAGWSSDTGIEPWVSDGTPEGTFTLENIEPGSASSTLSRFVPLGDGYLYFLNENEQGFELWRTDGTESGTTRRAYRDDGTTLDFSGSLMRSCGSQLLLSARDPFAGQEPWRASASGGLQRLANIAPDFGDADPFSYVGALGQLFFTAADAAGRELWTSDMTAAGTRRVEDLYPGPGGGVTLSGVEWNGALYTVGLTPDDGYELRKIVDPDGGSVVLRDIAPGPGSSFPGIPVPFGDRLLFTAREADRGGELWSSDGTELGTVPLEEVWPGEDSGVPYLYGLELDGQLYFEAEDGVHGEELWRTDGVGVELVRDLYLGPSDSAPEPLVVFQGELYFRALTESGRELWKTDGTAQGTGLVRDIDPAGSSSPFILGIVDSYILLLAHHPDYGQELWRSDGTEAGTRLVADIWPGPNSSSISDPVLVGGVLYFTATEPLSGREIWRSDGTGAGTFRVTELRPGLLSARPDGLVALPDGTFLFSAYTEEAGMELWRSDGTAAGTRRVTDIAPGSESSVFLSSFNSLVYGDWFVFTADNGVTGREPWAYRWNPETPLFADGFETGNVTLWATSSP